MTTPQCPTDDITCPQPANYAAVAKQLHKTALDVENRLFCQEQLLRAAVNMPANVITSTSAALGYPVNTPADVTGIATFVTTFRNTAAVTFSTALPAGVYHVGQYLNATPQGAATLNSYRLAYISSQETINGVNTEQILWETRTWETATGNGGDMTVTGLFRSNGRQRPIFYFQHGNTGSTMQLNIGTVAWIIRISDSTALRVV